MSSVYISEAPTRVQYLAAQAVLDQHVTSCGTGRCIECGALGPCYRREAAVSVISRTVWLPTRTPGLSRPQLVGARRVH